MAELTVLLRRKGISEATAARAAAELTEHNALRAHADIEYRAIRVAPNEVELGVVNVLRLFDAAAALVFFSVLAGLF